MLLSPSYNQTSAKEIKNNFVVNKVKEIVHRYDELAEIILFGSRARRDWHEDSDWDFLILSELDERDEAKEKIREEVLEEIENFTFDSVYIIHNKKVWEKNYSVTPLTKYQRRRNTYLMSRNEYIELKLKSKECLQMLL